MLNHITNEGMWSRSNCNSWLQDAHIIVLVHLIGVSQYVLFSNHLGCVLFVKGRLQWKNDLA